MDEITCVLGKKIKFTRERYIHIILRHLELEGMEEEIRNTLRNADFVQKSEYDGSVLLYYRHYDNRYFVVVAKVLNNHGFVITSYIADVVKPGELVWKK